ncbi:MAG: hypothetical protein AAF366_01405 [Pseudomonadota bacterium]
MTGPTDRNIPRRATMRRRDATAILPDADRDGPARLAAPPPDPNLPGTMLDWLSQMTLLYGVPFEYLVADPRLLPTESMRFFHLDRNWCDRMVDGALSTGVLSTADHVFNEALFEAVYQAIATHQQSLRANLRGKPAPKTIIAEPDYCGVVFRSVVVSGWPGLEVLPMKNGKPVDILRMDRLSDTVLIVLFAEVPDKVSFIEPSEGLHFGLLPPLGGTDDWYVNLRWLGLDGEKTHVAGTQIDIGGTMQTAPIAFRTGAGQPAGVVDVAATAKAIKAAMPAGALGPGDVLTPGGYAIQMVRGAGRQDYDVTAKTLCPASGGTAP